MPRTNGGHDGPRRDRDSGERSSHSSGGRGPRADLDAQALALRESGRSYAAVASTLGFKRSADARAAFVRAIKARPAEERPELVRREADRLDILEKRIRDRDVSEPGKMERRLVALSKLREALL